MYSYILEKRFVEYYIVALGHCYALDDAHKNVRQELVAQTHEILNSSGDTFSMGNFYLAQYFPQTMAAIIKLLLKEEGVKV